MNCLNISPPETFHCQRYSTPSLIEYANNNRTQKRFNDVTIQCNTTKIQANSMVLSCCSSYFEEILTSQVNSSVIVIDKVDGEVMELLIEFIYSGKISLSSDNVLNILEAADEMKINEIKEFCFKFLGNCLKTENCLVILATAKQYRNFALRDEVYQFISYYYESIIKTPAFETISNHEFFLIIYHLKVRFFISDDVLCRSLLNWTKQDEENRIDYFLRMIKFVNIDKLSYSAVKKMLVESLLQDNAELISKLRVKVEPLESKQTSIFALSKNRGKISLKIIFGLHDKAKKIYPDLQKYMYDHGSVKLNKSLFCIGGIANWTYTKQVFELNLDKAYLEWEEIAPINQFRGGPGVGILNDSLIVYGGFDSAGGAISSTEFYDSISKVWKTTSFLRQGRYCGQTVTSRGCLYALGGYDGSKYLSSVEQLNGVDQPWRAAPPMQASRAQFAAVDYRGTIYAIGGKPDSKSCEKFANGKWVYVADMNFIRWGHSACVMQNKIYVVGGWDPEKNPIKVMESYDPKNDRWKIVLENTDSFFEDNIFTF